MKRPLLTTAWLGFRSALLMIGFSLITGVLGFLAPLLAVFPYPWRVKYIQNWARLSLWWARLSCGIKWDIRGDENLDLSLTLYKLLYQHIHYLHNQTLFL